MYIVYNRICVCRTVNGKSFPVGSCEWGTGKKESSHMPKDWSMDQSIPASQSFRLDTLPCPT